jgi:hypothetical protein
VAKTHPAAADNARPSPGILHSFVAYQNENQWSETQRVTSQRPTTGLPVLWHVAGSPYRRMKSSITPLWKPLYAQPLSNYSCNFGDSPWPLENLLVTVWQHAITSAQNVPNESSYSSIIAIESPSFYMTNLRESSYLSHVIETTTSADQYWHHPRPDSRNTMI